MFLTGIMPKRIIRFRGTLGATLALNTLDSQVEGWLFLGIKFNETRPGSLTCGLEGGLGHVVVPDLEHVCSVSGERRFHVLLQRLQW